MNLEQPDIQPEDLAIYRLFNTTDGKIVLEYLDDLYGKPNAVVRGDPYLTHYNLGLADVIKFIRNTIIEIEGVSQHTPSEGDRQ